MAEKEKRRATTFRTSKGTIVNVAYPDIYISPAFISSADVTSPTEMREALREELREVSRRVEPVLPWRVAFTSPTYGETYFYSVAVFKGRLYVGSNNGRIYVFDGHSWSLAYNTGEAGVFVLVAYGSKLYAGTGNNGRVFEFNGTTWLLSYDSMESTIRSGIVYKNRLYMGTDPGGKVYRYDGVAWSEVYDSPEIEITSMGVYNDVLYLGTWPGGMVYRTSDGVTYSLAYDSPESVVNCFAVYKDRLYFGTGHTSGPYAKVYCYDGTSWSLSRDFGAEDAINAEVVSLYVYRGLLYAGTCCLGRIYVFDGEEWTLAYMMEHREVWQFATYRGRLYVLISGDTYAKVYVLDATETVVIEGFRTLRTDKDTHFIGAIAQNAKEDENVTSLAYNKLHVEDVMIQANENLYFRLLFWGRDTFDDTDLDADTFIGFVDLDLPSFGFRIAGANQYYLNVTDVDMDYEDLDETGELHVSLQCVSAAGKTAGAAGEVVVEVTYSERR